MFDVIELDRALGAIWPSYVPHNSVSRLGFKTAIVERENLGGVCLNWGCIPTKALLRSAEVFTLMRHAEGFGLAAERALRSVRDR
jgi:dihydrolipoamide dehydrogenase